MELVCSNDSAACMVIAADVVGKLVVVECLGAYVGVVVGVLAVHAVSK